MFSITDVLLRLVRISLNLINTLIGNLFYPSKLNYLPPIKNNLLFQPAIKLAEKIKKGQLKSEDLVKCYISRCKEINDELNAIVEDNFEQALEEARLVDERVQRELNGAKRPDEKSINEYPFLGVPFTTKDSIAVKGLAYSVGTVWRKDIKAEKDCDVIRLMKNGGGILLAITNVPELAMYYDSFNKVYGATNNPYDQSRIPGGSTGGDAALISACGSIFGIGSDIGGSIRIPSNFCGLFGHFATPKSIKIDEIFPPKCDSRLTMLSKGPLCRYACDLRPMLDVLTDGQLNLKPEQLNYDKLKIYYLEDLGDPLMSPVDRDILKGLDKVVKYFQSKNTQTFKLNMNKDDEKSFYDLRYAFYLWTSEMYDPSSGSSFNKLLSNGGEIYPVWELIKCMFGCNKQYTAGVLLLGLNEHYVAPRLLKTDFKSMLERLRCNLHKLLAKDTVLICPSYPDVAPKHNQTILRIVDTMYTGVWNTMNVCITAVPIGLNRSKMPFGLQIISAPGNDNLCIQIAEELEKQFGGWKPPCSIEI